MYPTMALKYILKSVMTTQFLPHGTRKGSHTILATLKCYKAFYHLPHILTLSRI